MIEAKYKTGTTILEPTRFFIRQAQCWLAEKYTEEFLPKMNWADTKQMWRFLPPRDRWFALAKRRLDLKASVNITVAQEIIHYFPAEREIVFTSNYTGPTMQKTRFNADTIRGEQ
jgi:hypothetical protein